MVECDLLGSDLINYPSKRLMSVFWFLVDGKIWLFWFIEKLEVSA